MPYSIPTSAGGPPPELSLPMAVSGSGDALTAAPDWAGCSILTVTLTGDTAIDVVNLPDGAARKLVIEGTDTKVVTFSTSTGTLYMQAGADTNPLTLDGSTRFTVHVTRDGSDYDLTILSTGSFS